MLFGYKIALAKFFRLNKRTLFLNGLHLYAFNKIPSNRQATNKNILLLNIEAALIKTVRAV